MPTKTRPSAELNKLIEKQSAAFRELQEVKRERAAYDDATQQQRAEYTAFCNSRPEDWIDEGRNPRPGTPSADLAKKVKARLAAPNPHEDAFRSKRDAFHAVDAALQTFRRESIGDLIEERGEEMAEVRSRITNALQELEAASIAHDELASYAKGLVRDCPGIDGQDLALDPRVNGLSEIATRALRDLDEHPLIGPGLTELGKWKLTQ